MFMGECSARERESAWERDISCGRMAERERESVLFQERERCGDREAGRKVRHHLSSREVVEKCRERRQKMCRNPERGVCARRACNVAVQCAQCAVCVQCMTIGKDKREEILPCA